MPFPDPTDFDRKYPVVHTATGWYRYGAPVPNLDAPPRRTPTFPDGTWVSLVDSTAAQQVMRSYYDAKGIEIAVLWPHPKDHSGFYYVHHLIAAPDPMPYSIDPIRRGPG
jgi:hypothetical protein